jgi:hypothetical protein
LDLAEPSKNEAFLPPEQNTKTGSSMQDFRAENSTIGGALQHRMVAIAIRFLIRLNSPPNDVPKRDRSEGTSKNGGQLPAPTLAR